MFKNELLLHARSSALLSNSPSHPSTRGNAPAAHSPADRCHPHKCPNYARPRTSSAARNARTASPPANGRANQTNRSAAKAATQNAPPRSPSAADALRSMPPSPAAAAGLQRASCTDQRRNGRDDWPSAERERASRRPQRTSERSFPQRRNGRPVRVRAAADRRNCHRRGRNGRRSGATEPISTHQVHTHSFFSKLSTRKQGE